MRRLMLATAGLLAMSVSASADQTIRVKGDHEIYIQPTNGPLVVCELLGISVRTAGLPGFEAAHQGVYNLLSSHRAFPHAPAQRSVEGYCMTAAGPPWTVVDHRPGWPINYGPYGRIIGLQCDRVPRGHGNDGPAYILCDFPSEE